MKAIIESILAEHNRTTPPGGGLDIPRELEHCKNTLTLINYLCITDNGGTVSVLDLVKFGIPDGYSEVKDDNLLILFMCLEYSLRITDARAILHKWQHLSTIAKNSGSSTYYIAKRLMGAENNANS